MPSTTFTKRPIRYLASWLTYKSLHEKYSTHSWRDDAPRILYSTIIRKHDVPQPLCTIAKPPSPGTAALLGLGLKFCLEAPRPFQDIDSSMQRFCRDMRMHCRFNLGLQPQQ
jgi:hypothetical protein